VPRLDSRMGWGVFCLRACDPAVENSEQYCDDLYDKLGCAFNAPASYGSEYFESCDAESGNPPGVYTGTDGLGEWLMSADCRS